MTSAGATLLAATAPSARGVRLGPLVEFLLVGGASLLLLPLAWLFREAVGLDTSELVVGFVAFHLAFIINDPHFSVTYLLFYQGAKRRAFDPVHGRAQRARFLFAGLVVPLVLAAWAAYAIVFRSAHALGLMMQLMFFLVGWHYVKQGFGVLTVLSARRGIRFTQRERRLVLFHCFSAWLYARASPFDPGTEYQEKGVVFTSLPHPPGAELVTHVALWLSTLGLAWALWSKWRRERCLPPFTGVVGFLVTVWLWVVYSSIDPLLVYLIPALHSLQYLYFVWLLKKNQATSEEGPPLFKRTVRVRLGLLAASAVVLAWCFFHGWPSFLDSTMVARHEAAGALGPTPFLAAIVTFVNIHHYFMDMVIWRRDNPDTRFLRDAAA